MSYIGHTLKNMVEQLKKPCLNIEILNNLEQEKTKLFFFFASGYPLKTNVG